MQFYFAESSRILTKTMPYLLLRIAIYCLISLATAVYLGLVILISKVFGSGGAVVFLIGLAVLVGLLRLLKQYVLYLINAGHIAVITELIEKEALPDNINQFQYGKTIVTNMFKDISVLFVVDRMVDGIIRTFNRTVASVADLLPVPGMEGLTRVVNAVIGFSLTFIDETILSYNLARKDENIWESAKRGIILYAQNWRPILTTAAASAAANFVGFIVLFLVLLVPFVPLALMTHSDALKFFWLALAFTLAYGLKLSVFNPFFQVSMILTFRSATAGQQPDAQWEARLEMASDKFLQLKEKALDFVQARSPNGVPH
jgi:hypothetical protein